MRRIYDGEREREREVILFFARGAAVSHSTLTQTLTPLILLLLFPISCHKRRQTKAAEFSLHCRMGRKHLICTRAREAEKERE